MKIFRGPSTKPLHDESHELVSTINVKQSASYINGTVVVLANVTKEPLERQAVAHIQFEDEDIFALHQRYIAGLVAKASALEEAKVRMSKASKRLYALFESIDLKDPEYECNPQDRITDLKHQLQNAWDEAGGIAADLDISNWQHGSSDA
jgi:hypothetical protein